MKLNISVIVLLALLGKTCSSIITIQKHHREKIIEHIVEATNKLLKSCYENKTTTVGVYGDLTDTLLGKQFSETIPVILIEHRTKLAAKIGYPIVSRKLEVFTILAVTPKLFRQMLEEIKGTPWWNHMASFFILNRKSINHCSKAYRFLRAAWKMNVLDANFLCVDDTNKLLLYSYNPYTERAPSPWKLWNTTKVANDQPWSMFVREYRDDKAICDGLNFDKTNDLGGYPIRCSVRDDGIGWRVNRNKTGTASFLGVGGTAARLWFRTMNAEANVLFHDARDPFSFVDENGNERGILKDFTDRTSDVVLNSYYFDEMMNFTLTYPHLEGGLGIATQLSRPKSTLSKINSVIDIRSRYGLYFVILVTPVILKFVSRRALAPAVLDTVLIICNSVLPKPPKNTAARIFLVALFSFQVTILALYSGQLASLLTKPAYHRNVETIQDLGKLGYTIYAHKSISHLFTDPIFDDRFIGLDYYDCLEYVYHDSTAACVASWQKLRSNGFDSTLRLSRGMIKKSSLVNAIREDWPLVDRFNEIVAMTVENGVLWEIYANSSKEYAKVEKFNEKLRSQSSCKIINFNELSFAFVILAIGLGCATVAFLFEMAIG